MKIKRQCPQIRLMRSSLGPVPQRQITYTVEHGSNHAFFQAKWVPRKQSMTDQIMIWVNTRKDERLKALAV